MRKPSQETSFRKIWNLEIYSEIGNTDRNNGGLKQSFLTVQCFLATILFQKSISSTVIHRRQWRKTVWEHEQRWRITWFMSGEIDSITVILTLEPRTHPQKKFRRNEISFGANYFCQMFDLISRRNFEQKKFPWCHIFLSDPRIALQKKCWANEILDRIHMLCQDLQPLLTLCSPEILCLLPYKPLSERSSILARWYKISSFDWIDLFLVVVETNVKLFATISSFDLIDVFVYGLL